MANPPTQPDVQTVAGAAEFDGLTGTTGFLDFSDYINGLSLAARVKILGISYNGTGGAAVQLDIVLQLAGAAATTAIVLASEAAATTRVILCGGGLWVPKNQTSGISWDLICTTTGKSAAATLVVDWVLDTVE